MKGAGNQRGMSEFEGISRGVAAPGIKKITFMLEELTSAEMYHLY